MAMQTDVKATVALTSTGNFTDAGTAGSLVATRTRIRGFYAVCGATAGSVTIADGNGGATLLVINTPASTAQGVVFMTLPGEGILATTGLYGTVSNTTSCVLFYG